MKKKLIQRLNQLFDLTKDFKVAEDIRTLKMTNDDVEINLIKDKYGLNG